MTHTITRTTLHTRGKRRNQPKAYLIERAGHECWIKAAWLREDGTLTPKGEEALASAKPTVSREDYAAAKKAEREAMIQLAPASWESEKAIGIDALLTCVHTHQSTTTRIFIPKSQIKNGSVPAWLVDAKIDDLASEIVASGRGNTEITGIFANNRSIYI